MSLSISRAVLDALLPPGSLWVPEELGDLDNLLSGVADNSDAMVDFLGQLALLRNPAKTTMLSDLEKEYGLRINTNKTDAERRAALAAAMTDRVSDGSLDTLQAKLVQAGFDVLVHANSPPVNPLPLISQAFDTQFGRSTCMFGRAESMFNYGLAGEMLVNGNVFGDSIFTIPVDSGYWPLFFFVGSTADRDEETGHLQTIVSAQVTVARRDEIKRLILKYKPMHTWCGLLVRFV